jgi:hypothetical protein
MNWLKKWASDPVRVLNALSVFLAGIGVGLIVERGFVASRLGEKVEIPNEHSKECRHSWTEESRQNGWRSSCRLCGKEAAGSGQ